jgi:hypothetical protein
MSAGTAAGRTRKARSRLRRCHREQGASKRRIAHRDAAVAFPTSVIFVRRDGGVERRKGRFFNEYFDAATLGMTLAPVVV